MSQCIVVTHKGPCCMRKALFEKILGKKDVDKEFGGQVLFNMEISDGLNMIVEGTMPEVRSFEEFERQYILPFMEVPRGRRNLII